MYGKEQVDNTTLLRGRDRVPDDNMSMNVQKIENGFLISTSGNKDGKFFQRITFVEHEWRLGGEVERLWNDFSAKPIEPVAPPDDDVPF